MRLLLWFLFAFGSATFAAFAADTQAGRPERWWVRVAVQNRAELQDLAALMEPLEVDQAAGTVLFLADEVQIDRLIALGFEPLDAQPVSIPFLRGDGGIPGFPCYPTVDETLAQISTWSQAYPDLVEIVDIGDSWRKLNEGMGDDLLVLRLTAQNQISDKAPWFAMGALHAREYTTAPLLTRFAQTLLEGYGVDADITWMLDHQVFHFLLIANPDGRREAESGLFWRKNTDNDFCSDSNDRGVDLNRNFTFEWGCCSGSSGSACNETFRGPSAGSEPETDAIMQYLTAQFPDNRGPDPGDGVAADAAGVFLDIHSFGEYVLWPYGYTVQDSPDNAALQRMGRKLAFLNGHRPEKASESFNTDGTSDDWAYGELGLAAFTFEIGTSFFQSCQSYEALVVNPNLAALHYSARVARAPFAMPAGPDVIQLSLDRRRIGIDQSVVITALAEDGRYSNANGTEPVQAVAAVQLTVDTPPWQDDSGALLFDADDGIFDESSEAVTISLAGTGLAGGRHTLFVRARDQNGDWGPTSAAFITVQNLPMNLLPNWPDPDTVLDLVAALNAARR